MFEKIGIIAKAADADVRAALGATLNVLRRRNVDIALDAHCAAVADDPSVAGLPDREVVHDRDLVIAIGGDGTLLRAAKLAFPGRVSMLGVNLGRLGFLTDLNPEHVQDALGNVLDGRFTSEERCVLKAEIRRGEDLVARGEGVNDIVIQKWNTARLIAFDTYVDDSFVLSQRSDGMIVSTPTGSTAYSLSGGGPIMQPELPAVVLVPICPHALTNRPIVLADSSIIDIVIAPEYANESRVTCDGEPLPPIEPGDRIRIARHDQNVHLIHPAGHDHFANLRAKLHWGRAPC